MRRQKLPQTCANRRGVAASELAVCLPVLVLLVLAMIEACTMIFLKQSLTVASYEGIRQALQPSASVADVEAKCNAVLVDRRVQGGQITIRPRNFQSLAPGEFIEVTVSAPAGANSVIPGSFFRGRTLSASATMMKEF
ncbi:MAG TPA: TadE/TadG family type IV pilus assembly protein [Lacipirellula sp.]